MRTQIRLFQKTEKDAEKPKAKLSSQKREVLESLSRDQLEKLAQNTAEAAMEVATPTEAPVASSSSQEEKWVKLQHQVDAMKRLNSGLLNTIKGISDESVQRILYSEAARELAEILEEDKKDPETKATEDEDSNVKPEGDDNKAAVKGDVIKTEKTKKEPGVKKATMKGVIIKPANQKSISAYFPKGLISY